jgi:tetratricopeptide (TPR) repeat protein
LLELSLPAKAAHVLHDAEQRGRRIGFGSQQAILNLLGEAYLGLNNTKEAERWYRAALAEKPDHIPAYLTYGKMLAKNVRLLKLYSFIKIGVEHNNKPNGMKNTA